MLTQPGSDVKTSNDYATMTGSQPVKVQLVTQQYGNKTFEFVQAPLVITASEERVRLPFGIELEGRYTELPVFAGGSFCR